MLLIPCAGDHEIVGSSQFDTTVRLRLVEDDLGTVDVHDSVADQSVIDIMETHRAKVVAAHATEFKAIPLVLGHPDILKSLRGFPNTFDQGALLVFLELNGAGFAAPDAEVVTVMTAVASGAMSEAELARWVRRSITPAATSA